MPSKVRADEYSLEDVLTHLLTNADRHRAPGSDITITLEVTGDRASVRVHNAGEQIPAELFERIFPNTGVGPRKPGDRRSR